MEVQIFNEITTERALSEIESEATKYDGLYVEMEDKEQRKFVKDHAAGITSLLKKLDRARIDKTKSSKLEIDAEFKVIKERLEQANKPFTLLIDEYKVERQKVLDAEKARKQAILDAEQKEMDHELAILEDKARAFEKAEQERLQKEREQELSKQAEIDKAKALEDAERKRIADIEAAKQQEINNQIAREREIERQRKEREANLEHKKLVNNEALIDLVKAGLNEDQARVAIIAIAKKEISHVTINY